MSIEYSNNDGSFLPELFSEDRDYLANLLISLNHLFTNRSSGKLQQNEIFGIYDINDIPLNQIEEIQTNIQTQIYKYFPQSITYVSVEIDVDNSKIILTLRVRGLQQNIVIDRPL